MSIATAPEQRPGPELAAGRPRQQRQQQRGRQQVPHLVEHPVEEQRPGPPSKQQVHPHNDAHARSVGEPGVSGPRIHGISAEGPRVSGRASARNLFASTPAPLVLRCRLAFLVRTATAQRGPCGRPGSDRTVTAARAHRDDPQANYSCPVVNTGRESCRCGHTRDAHEHYRGGTECSLCPSGECHGYVRLNGLRDRFSKLLRPKSQGNRST